MSQVIQNRYEFVVLFDVENGNPNGDPDAGNMPRVDPQTGYGFVTDVSLKRKIRNYVQTVKNDEMYYKIYVKEGAILNQQQEWAYDSLGLEKKKVDNVEKARAFMCENFFDVRTFGAVMNTGDAKCGQVRGPVQINFARSIDKVFAQDVAITRVAITNEKDKSETNSGNATMGRKFIIPYALYRTEGYISANLANTVTGFHEDDLQILFEAIENLFEHDHSATRGKMVVRKLIVFKHDSILGNAPSHKLFETVKVKKNANHPPRSYGDYEVVIDRERVPSGVTLIERA